MSHCPVFKYVRSVCHSFNYFIIIFIFESLPFGWYWALKLALALPIDLQPQPLHNAEKEPGTGYLFLTLVSF